MGESLHANTGASLSPQNLSASAEFGTREQTPGGNSTPGHVLHYVRGLCDYGWNEPIASAIVSGNYGAAAAFCAQARAECLHREQLAPHRPSAEKHFSNYMKFWILEARIERLSYYARRSSACADFQAESGQRSHS